ncbi:hypothetical protein PR048_031486 [Dryococelus australis]|uniref:Uncharacterized protein n=1 Tax=Dryococelus australis TaxID=614101 RepID=A0ABQ9G5E3_9NEOP|nr:hypothetical protein PR048_031486 [Dryococelus australis]
MAGSFTVEKTCNRNVAMLTVDNYLVGTKSKKKKCLGSGYWIRGHTWICFDLDGNKKMSKKKCDRENFEGVIAEINSANKAWKKLDELGNDGGLVNGAMNTKQLTHFVKPKDMSVQDYFSKINQSWKKTTKSRYEFTERQVAGMIIGNPTEEFAVCVHSLEAEMT